MTNTTTVYTEKKEERYIILFLTGLALYCIGYLLRRIGEETDIIRQPLQYLGFLILIIAAYKSISFRRNHYSTYIQYSMYALLLWHIYTILHNFSITSESLMTYFQPYFFFHLFVPLIVFFPTDKLVHYFIRWGLICIPFFFIFGILFIVPLFKNQSFTEQFVWVLGTTPEFLYLLSPYLRNKNILYAGIITALSVLIPTIMARRNLMLTYGNFFILGTLILSISKLKHHIQEKMIGILFLCISCFALYAFFSSGDLGIFQKIYDRISVNNREELFISFIEDMSQKDWIIGKGIDGTYYAPGIDGQEFDSVEDKDDRFLIECGYLQVILKGGVVNLILLLNIFISAIYLGLFKSKNKFCKIAGFVILLWLIDMFPWGMPALDFRYLLVWICSAICINKNIRNFSEEQITKYFAL